MNYNDEEKFTDLSIEFPNIIRSYKTHILPLIVQDFAIIDIYLSHKSDVFILSQYPPIRYGVHCGTRLKLRSIDGGVDYNPKLIWNGNEWLLKSQGSFYFLENELNYKEVSA